MDFVHILLFILLLLSLTMIGVAKFSKANKLKDFMCDCPVCGAPAAAATKTATA